MHHDLLISKKKREEEIKGNPTRKYGIFNAYFNFFYIYYHLIAHLLSNFMIIHIDTDYIFENNQKN